MASSRVAIGEIGGATIIDPGSSIAEIVLEHPECAAVSATTSSCAVIRHCKAIAMIEGQGSSRPSRERSELQLLRGEHGNIAQLLLVLESHLALMIMGEPFNGVVILDTVDYLIDYVGDFHRAREDRVVAAVAAEQPSVRFCAATVSAQHDALQTSGVELYHRLDLAIRDESINRGEVVRLGYAYCTELRQSMSIEEAALSTARQAVDRPATERPQSDGEARYRARFEELTQRIGCGCDYGER